MKLTVDEARVFGCLIEKSQATPEYYPMSLHAVVAACNQKTSRDPVVTFSQAQVLEALEHLKDKGLCAAISGDGRVIKYAHRGGENGLQLNRAQLAVLSLLLLRGPQTPGEIKTRAGRQYEFASLEEVQNTLASLMTAGEPMVEMLERSPGQKENRYRHLFHEEGAGEARPASIPAEMAAFQQRIAALQAENQALRERLGQLEAEIAQLKTDLC